MNWTLTIKEFGPFNNTSLELKPLTIFIGKNSLGKSLILRLLWSLSSAEPDYKEFSKEFMRLGGYSRRENLSLKDKEAIKDYVNVYMKAFSFSLLKGIQNKIKEIFGKTEGEIEVTSELANIKVSTEGQSILEPSLDKLIDIDINTISPLNIVFKFKDVEKSEYYVKTKEELDDALDLSLLYFTYSRFEPFFQADTNRIFLIDGRAGLTRFFNLKFLKTLDFLDIISKEYLSSYSLLLEDFSKGKVDFNLIKDFFNELGFDLKLIETEGIKSPYVKMWNEVTLPLSEAPSGIREALPITLALASKEVSVIYIEEPEAHLHPKAQRIMAKMISDAVKNGKYVFLTTHSDYLLYSISNLIAMSQKDKKGLDHNKVAVYLLKRDGEYTRIDKVEVNEDGINEDEFTKVAEELLDEKGKIYD
ncbi:AAA family ATPase [Sulfurisphaera tokodaii]|uniref:Endonuclease GajA/Old nuclease/RecF-like AAA domain-containing protein n=2 Tax=Sulfurisphaera tokodaii TaxID=111955 RepID=Q970M1_SULTO|nr:AAA family ATPase [Sulfurisphaera tokodaii]BAB66652.1 hypothetical protein STK_15760 [Sulfurisphaera tokodaii str. 7]HII73527.1 AAA family ATPase [Sulfurisphaera tokodaii]